MVSRVWGASLAGAVIGPAVAAVLVALPICGQLTDVCSSQRYSWTLFSGDGFGVSGLSYGAIDDEGRQQPISPPVGWFACNAEYSPHALEVSCRELEVEEAVRDRRGDEVDRLRC